MNGYGAVLDSRETDGVPVVYRPKRRSGEIGCEATSGATEREEATQATRDPKTRLRVDRFLFDSEGRFADLLRQRRIAYVYQPEPIPLGDLGEYWPDFYIPEMGVYYEVAGSRSCWLRRVAKLHAVALYRPERIFVVNPSGYRYLNWYACAACDSTFYQPNCETPTRCLLCDSFAYLGEWGCSEPIRTKDICTAKHGQPWMRLDAPGMHSSDGCSDTLHVLGARGEVHHAGTWRANRILKQSSAVQPITPAHIPTLKLHMSRGWVRIQGVGEVWAEQLYRR